MIVRDQKQHMQQRSEHQNEVNKHLITDNVTD